MATPKNKLGVPEITAQKKVVLKKMKSREMADKYFADNT